MTQGGHMSMDDRADQKIMSGPPTMVLGTDLGSALK